LILKIKSTVALARPLLLFISRSKILVGGGGFFSVFVLGWCGFFFKANMLPQARDWVFNMEICSFCGEKSVSHTESAVEIQAETKTERPF
jgi:hypothetical protein